MVKEIEKEILGNLDWLVTRFKSLAVKLIGFVLTLWLVVSALGIGLVLPMLLVKASLFHGNSEKMIVAKEDRVRNTVNRVSYQMPIAARPVTRNSIRDASNTLDELRRFGSGVESLIRR